MIKRILLGFCFIIFASTIAYVIYLQKAPEFFPLNDTKATYSIIKADTGLVNGKGLYFVYYKGDKGWKPPLPDTVKVMVGQSKVELAPFLNKNVIVKGSFSSGNSQCIINQCRNFTNSTIVINIDSLQIK